MNRSFGFTLLMLGALAFPICPIFSAEPPLGDPVYIQIDNGWKGLYGHDEEYAEFSLGGEDVKIQDAYHIFLKRGLGLMVGFADKKEFGRDNDVLAAHAQWELNYWREKANKVESTTREDLSGARKDLRVTEIRVFNKEGARMTSYLIGLGSEEGVFVLSISPIDKSVDPMVKEIVHSFKLVHKKLDAAEIKRISSGLASKK